MKGLIRLALAAAVVAAPAISMAQAAKPVVAVLYFDNNSFGANRADFDGLGKGIADMLITDMASNSSVTVVERDRIQSLLTEQSLTKQGTIDPQTAIRLGKIIGAQYMITGGFMSDGKGTLIVTARAINVETSAITNPTKLTSKGDDVLGLINNLSTRLNTDMKLPALRVGQGMGATPGVQPASAPAQVAMMPQPSTPAPTPAGEPTSSASQTAAAPAPAVPPHAPANRAAPQQKMDLRTALLYSRALEEEDAGNRSRAVELYKQVVDKFPDYAPARLKIERLSRG